MRDLVLRGHQDFRCTMGSGKQDWRRRVMTPSVTCLPPLQHHGSNLLFCIGSAGAPPLIRPAAARSSVVRAVRKRAIRLVPGVMEDLLPGTASAGQYAD